LRNISLGLDEARSDFQVDVADRVSSRNLDDFTVIAADAVVRRCDEARLSYSGRPRHTICEPTTIPTIGIVSVAPEELG